MSQIVSTASKLRLEQRQEQPSRGTATHYSSGDGADAASTPRKRPRSTSIPRTAAPGQAVHSVGSSRSQTPQETSQQKIYNRHVFQIRVGSVVALRMGKAAKTPIPMTTITTSTAKTVDSSGLPQPQQSVVDLSSYTTVWTNPDPRRDAGLALVGHKIRCAFPKVKHPTKNQRTVLEGEIIGVEEACHQTREVMDDASCWAVELLIEERVLPFFPTLRRLDTHWDDDAKAADDKNNNSQNPLSAKAKKRLAMERQIQGLNTAVVQVLLWKRPDWVGSKSSSSTARKWVIEKRVPAQLFHPPRFVGSPTWNATSTRNINGDNTTPGINTMDVSHDREQKNGKSGNGNGKVQGQQQGQQQEESNPPLESKKKPRITSAASVANQQPSMLHVGDGHDSPEQQIANWRWLACHFHDWRRSRHCDVDPTEFLAAGFVGHVVAMQPSRGNSTTTASTLAQVTVRRLFWPEHLRCGRLPHLRRHWNQLFQDGDVDVQIEVPVEHLVMVGRKLCVGNNDGAANELWMPWAYSWRHDCFQAVVDPVAALTANIEAVARPSYATDEARTTIAITTSLPCICHRCRRPRNHLTECTCPNNCPLQQQRKESWEPTRFCKSCLTVLAKQRRMKEVFIPKDAKLLPCCTQSCDCPSCEAMQCTKLQTQVLVLLMEAFEKLQQQQQRCVATGNNKSSGFFNDAVAAVHEMEPVDFSLPANFLDPCRLPIPQAKPSKRIKKAKMAPGKSGKLSGKQKARLTKIGREPGRPRTSTKKSVTDRKSDVVNSRPSDRLKEDYSVFKPTCARTQIYDPTLKCTGPIVWSDPVIPDNHEPVRNLRDVQERNSRLLTAKKDDSVRALGSSRALRANQRRLMKDVASLGMTTASLGVDALASREPQLRFDRSSIHAWGVFADEDISAGEMIVEYRGELIGNAVAERREVEYEAAKIGSDYMFRIDALNVCDATKQGNVARFINASCDPNCYTKIITLDGTKRIVIYAKKDISMGDELCYDYKFPVEYEESRRIPCHCGARDCRGFMNWDKRYVLVPAAAKIATKLSSLDQQPQCYSHRPLKCAAEGDATEEANDSAM